MSAGDDSFGGTPVGPIDALGPVGAAAVAYLRLWTDGAAAQAQVWNAFAVRLGPAEGRSALRTLERICDLCMRHGRRPLMLHQAGCRCLGADEACFATVVETAACGEREDALGAAVTMVRADIAPLLVAEAQNFGLALQRMALRHCARPSAPRPQVARLLH